MLTLRNSLAHRYFHERVDDFLNPEGRAKMTHDLETTSNELYELYTRLDDLVVGWLQAPHRTSRDLVERFNRMAREI
jgi:hypothetical protein